jgi:hypothetical protein
MKKKNAITFITMLLCAATISVNAQSWSLTGNAGTTTTNYIGTRDLKPLIFKTNKVMRMQINPSGGMYITDGGPNTPLLSGEKSSQGIGVWIRNTSPTNSSAAIHGYTAGTGAGITGQASQAGSAGVYGYSDDGYGVKGYSTGSYGIIAHSWNYYGILAQGAGYAGYFISNVFASGGYYAGSDQKLKQDIQDFNSGMDIINKLHPKKYNYRQDGNYKLMKLPQGTQYGLIAQDVEKVLPELVKDTKFETSLGATVTNETSDSRQNIKSESLNFKALNYTGLIPIMIKGMQEQEQKLQQQQEQIQKQSEQINNQNKKIEELSALVNQQVQARLSDNAIVSNKIVANTASLQQNAPNPFHQNTIINYYVPHNAGKAFINITDMSGRLIKTVPISAKGGGQLMVDGGQLTSGTYQYSFYMDGKLMETKQMILVK